VEVSSKTIFAILIICRPESRFLELIPREESEDSESAIPRLILKRQNTPSDDSTPPKVKYLLQVFAFCGIILRPNSVIHILYLPAEKSLLSHGPYLKPRARFFPMQTDQGRQRTCSVFLYGIPLRVTIV